MCQVNTDPMKMQVSFFLFKLEILGQFLFEIIYFKLSRFKKKYANVFVGVILALIEPSVQFT
jgi:hypothetical protein